MIVLEVSLNGKRVCVAGAENLCVLTSHVTAVGKLGRRTVPARPDETSGEIHYSVGGLTARQGPRKNVHLRWKSVVPLKVGAVIQVRILETDTVDHASSRQRAKAQSGSRQRRVRGVVSKRNSSARRA